MAQLLVRISPHIIDPRAKDDYAFRYACWMDHPRVIRWLLKVFPDISHRVCNDHVFRDECMHPGHNTTKFLGIIRSKHFFI